MVSCSNSQQHGKRRCVILKLLKQIQTLASGLNNTHYLGHNRRVLSTKNFVLKGLSHEMGFTFDDMDG